MRPNRILPFLVVAAAACSTPGTGVGTPAPGPGTTDVTIPIPGGPGGTPVAVVAVLDGDSIVAEIDGAEREIRMLGINAPERGECWSDRAKEATESALGAGGVLLDDRGEDQYGRVLGYLTAGDVYVNAALVAGGAALAMSDDHPDVEAFRRLEEAAFAAGAGLWAADACGPDLGTGLRIAAVDGDPPGRDEDPGDGESVTVVNDGAAAVDLDGWQVRDESSVHRYRFPLGVSLAPGGDILVYSVCGQHPYCFGDETVWSNGGDTALLLDPSGNVVDRMRFTP